MEGLTQTFSQTAEGVASWNSQTAKKEPVFFRRHITWASVQEHGPFPACKSCHALLGGHSAACKSRFERIWKDADLIKATAEVVKGARQANSSAATKETSSATQQMSGTSSNSSGPAHQAGASSAADTTKCSRRPSSRPSVHAVSAERNCVVVCLSLLKTCSCNPERVEMAGMGAGKEGSSIDTSSVSTRMKTKRNLNQGC